ncbi:hypothetical protein LDENG_00230650 [Lucifuga dentata]|nr:hypothetical protein LDENG_00230650 [Lucifuga dentata]
MGTCKRNHFSPILMSFHPSHSLQSSSAALLSVPTFRLNTWVPKLSAALHPNAGTHFHFTSASWTPSYISNHRLKHTCLN